MSRNRKQSKKAGRKTVAKHNQGDWTATYANSPMGDQHISLSGFLQKQLPDVTLIKMVYSDYRTITASASQASYVYRFNSCFDPDFTGVGGQPDGFDQWKTLYQQYRVMACEVHVHAAALAGAALVTLTPSVSSTVGSSAEEQVGIRRASGALTNVSGQVAKLRSLFRVGDTYGVPDSSVLNNDNYAGPITGSPSSSAFARIECETSGASDAIAIWVTLTMYTRFEKPFDTLDSVGRRRALLPQTASTQGQPGGVAVVQEASCNRLAAVAASLERASSQLAALASPVPGLH